MNVAIVKYNAGNVQSVTHALERLGISPSITDDAAALQQADKVIFPGVGEANSAMRYLKARALDRVIADLRQPVLGICLGLQLLCAASEENDTPCLGVFPEQVRRFKPNLKVPHMGWNALEECQGPMFAGLGSTPFVYFVHSFYAESGPDTVAVTDYITRFGAAMQRDNFYAVQFHPEKSGPVGATILNNFLSL